MESIQGILLSKEILQHFLSAIKSFKYLTFSGIEGLHYQRNRSTKKPKHNIADLEFRLQRIGNDNVITTDDENEDDKHNVHDDKSYY